MCTPTQGVWQPAGCVSCELVCVCVSLVRVVIICPASTHTALVSSPSLAVLHLSTYLPTCLTSLLSLPLLDCLCLCVLGPELCVYVKFVHRAPQDWGPSGLHSGVCQQAARAEARILRLTQPREAWEFLASLAIDRSAACV